MIPTEYNCWNLSRWASRGGTDPVGVSPALREWTAFGPEKRDVPQFRGESCLVLHTHGSVWLRESRTGPPARAGISRDRYGHPSLTLHGRWQLPDCQVRRSEASSPHASHRGSQGQAQGTEDGAPERTGSERAHARIVGGGSLAPKDVHPRPAAWSGTSLRPSLTWTRRGRCRRRMCATTH